MSENKKVMGKYFVPLISFLIFLAPLIMDAVQIEIESGAALPAHWQLVMSAIFSAGVSTILIIMRRVYESFQIDYDKEIAELKNQIKVLEIGRNLDEKQILATTAQLGDQWLEKNATIEQIENLLAILKKKVGDVDEDDSAVDTGYFDLQGDYDNTT